MLLGDKIVNVDITVDNPIVNVNNIDLIREIVYSLKTENNEPLRVPVYLPHLEPLPNIICALPTVNNEPLIIPVNLKSLPFNFLLETEDLVPIFIYGSLSFETTFNKSVAGIKRTYGQIVAPITFTKAVDGFRVGPTYYGSTALSVTFTKSVSATKKTFAQLARSITFVKDVSATKKTFGSILMPITASIGTAGIGFAPAPSFKAVGSIGSSSGNTDPTPALPAGWAAGDFAILFGWVDLRSGNSLDTASISGWTNLANLSGSVEGGMRVWYRFLQSGDSAPSVPLAGSGSWLSTDASSAVICTFSNVNTSNPTNGTPQSNAGGGSPATTSAITTSVDNCLIATLLARGDNEGFSTETYGGSSTGVSEFFDLAASGGDDSELAAFGKVLSSAGSSGSASAATSSVDPWIAYTIALRPV